MVEKWQQFYCKFLAESTCERILNIGWYLAKSWREISFDFFWLTVQKKYVEEPVAINTARDRKWPQGTTRNLKNTTRDLSVITSSFTSSYTSSLTYLLFTTVHITCTTMELCNQKCRKLASACKWRVVDDTSHHVQASNLTGKFCFFFQTLIAFLFAFINIQNCSISVRKFITIIVQKVFLHNAPNNR